MGESLENKIPILVVPGLIKEYHVIELTPEFIEERRMVEIKKGKLDLSDYYLFQEIWHDYEKLREQLHPEENIPFIGYQQAA